MMTSDNPVLRRPRISAARACNETRQRCIDGYGISVSRVTQPQDGDRAGAAHVLLVHGMVDSAATWARLLPGLADCHVWLADLPWSGCNGAQWTHVMGATAWWQAALELCPVRPTVCVGHSFAATVLLDWALAPVAPATDGLVLLAPFYCGAPRDVPWSEIDAFARAVPTRLADGLRARLAQRQPSEGVVGAMAQRLCQRCMPDAMLELMRLFLKSRSHDLARLAVPLLVACGAHEQPLLRQSFSDLRQACDASADARTAPATFHELHGCGHHPMHEQPARLLDLLAAFTRRLQVPQTVSRRLPCLAI